MAQFVFFFVLNNGGCIGFRYEKTYRIPIARNII